MTGDDLKVLFKFYGVDSLVQLVEKQQNHIEKLQWKVEQFRLEQTTGKLVREG